MNQRILLVDSSREALRALERLLQPDHDVATARDRASALELLRDEGPFGAIVCDHDLGGEKGTGLLAKVHEEWPDCVPILMTGLVEVDVVIEALHAGRIFRFLERPCTKERLREVVGEALVENERRRESRRRAVELAFSSRVLSDFNGRLEELVSERTTSLVSLHRYVSDLNACQSLEDVAAATVDAVRAVCPERGVFMELWDGSAEGERCQMLDGPELTPKRHVQTVETGEGQVGSIVVASSDRAGRPLSRTQRAMLASMAASCAVATHNQIRRRERDEAQQATILALARLAEQRDNETGKHLERVSLFCKLIAEALRAHGHHTALITDRWVRDLVRSAPLHDIGKVGIPDRILLKPGKLDPDEWEIMKTHAEIGAETLRSVVVGDHVQSFLAMSTDIAACHHEKWDGSGYPRGLAGEDIPLAARILALADVYDALTSRRPYKEPWTHEDAVRWIEEGAGTHFDPRVVAAFLARKEEARSIRERLADTDDDLARIGLAAA